MFSSDFEDNEGPNDFIDCCNINIFKYQTKPHGRELMSYLLMAIPKNVETKTCNTHGLPCKEASSLGLELGTLLSLLRRPTT